jgi:hypothetical protein
MSGLPGQVYASRTITIRILFGLVFSLIVVGLICTLLTHCPSVVSSQQWDIPEDQGVRLSDHNWILIELGF